MLSADLASVFAPNPTGMFLTPQVVQGRILTFSSVDGSNTVQVIGTTLTNVPMLMTGAEIEFVAGDPVLLMVLGNTYFLIGKVANVGSAQFASASVATQSAYFGTTGGFAVPATTTTFVTLHLNVPKWANTASIMSTFNLDIFNNFGADTDGFIQQNLDGEIDNHLDFYCHNNSFALGSVTNNVTHSVTGGATLTLLGQGSANGGFTNDGVHINFAAMSAMAMYTKQ